MNIGKGLVASGGLTGIGGGEKGGDESSPNVSYACMKLSTNKFN